MMESSWTWAIPWWGSIVGINLINFIIAAFLFGKSRKSDHGTLSNYAKIMRISGLVFVTVGFYRSIFVSRYYTQLGWFDTLLNSTLLIRTFAFFAELSFAALIMYGLLQMNKDLPMPNTLKTSRFRVFLETKTPYIFFTLLALAQIGAYGGSITKMYLLFAIEETFWGFAFLSITPLVLIQLKRVLSVKDSASKHQYHQYKRFIIILAIFCIGYSIYSLGYHLPIEYWPKAIKQISGSTPDPAIRWGWSAVKDTFLTVNASREYAAWGGMGFIIWHSGYFTLCEWMAMYFMIGPRKVNKIGK